MRARRRTGLLAAEFQLLSPRRRALLRDGGDGLTGAGEIVLRGRQVATRLWSDERAR